ncbi:hypothetical protein HOLleu_04214 [Holothuria leucospilota]|uniref:A to I editase domain-containing protein n=1 Tax=Holothuria leucospilota TaxID=206669 RepID=A0A9Q1CTY4_HOLLE|nr:hypothetical protein HOLleu_04214 [Holothuria leucospilota]
MEPCSAPIQRLKPLTEHDQFAEKVEQQVQEMNKRVRLAVGKDLGPTHVLAAFVCEDADNSNLYVISFGTGTNWIAHENLAMDGRTVFDSHAEVIARRGFKR